MVANGWIWRPAMVPSTSPWLRVLAESLGNNMQGKFLQFAFGLSRELDLAESAVTQKTGNLLVNSVEGLYFSQAFILPSTWQQDDGLAPVCLVHH